jgi:hypothetical protein
MNPEIQEIVSLVGQLRIVAGALLVVGILGGVFVLLMWRSSTHLARSVESLRASIEALARDVAANREAIATLRGALEAVERTVSRLLARDP